jgi:hypothetical protein
MPRTWNLYRPVKCTWEQAYNIATATREKINAKALIELRIAYAGCYVAKYYMGSQRVGDQWIDLMQEVKVYDNTPYLEDITCEQKLEK